MKITNVPIKDINRDGRHRKDMGDIPALWQNIKDYGLLQPIVINKSGDLVVGGRRLEAFIQGGQETIPAVVSPDYNTLAKLLQAEKDENQFRKDFTISEKVAMAKSLEQALAEAAKERKGGKKKPKKGEETFVDGIGTVVTIEGEVSPEANGHVAPADDDGGKSRDLAAASVDMSGETYRKAKEVIEAAAKAPNKYGHLVEEMDTTGKVNGAHKQLKILQAPKPKKQEAKEGEEEDKIVDAKGTVVEQKGLRDKFADEKMGELVDTLEECLTDMRSLSNPLKEISNWNPWLRMTRNQGEETPAIVELMTTAIKAAKAAKEQIDRSKPHLVCKACGGGKCKECRQTGFWPEWRATEEEGRPAG